jgi:hypothetical protein
MDINLILEITAVTLSIISAVAGTKYQTAKTKAAAVTKLLTDVIDAAEDDKISEEEFQKIVADAKNVVETDKTVT